MTTNIRLLNEGGIDNLVDEIVKRTTEAISTPRSVLDETKAAQYVGSGLSTLRSYRGHDQQLIEFAAEEVDKADSKLGAQVADGLKHPIDAAAEAGIDLKPMKGPRWFRQGRAIRYALVDLDAWIASRRAAVMTADKTPPRGVVARLAKRGRRI